MLKKDRIIQLSDDLDGSVYYLSDTVTLGEGQRESWETITRVVRFEDVYYGEVDITRAKLNQMVRNFDAGVYGQNIFIDVSHRPDHGSAGEIKELTVQGNKLRARIDWTEYGVDAVTKRGFRYFSADFHENYKDPESGKKHGALLRGAGLTTRPRVKRLDTVEPSRLQLSFDGDRHYVVSPRISRILHDEVIEKMNEHLKKLRKQLEAKKLSEKAITAILAAAEKAMKPLGDDTDQITALMEQMAAAGDAVALQLAEGHTGEIRIEVAAPQGGNVLSEDDIKRILADDREAEATRLAEVEGKRKANVKLFTDAINSQDGFSDELKKQLCEGVEDLITADMTEAQIKSLSDNQVAMGNRLSAQQALANRGFQFGGPAGNVHISMDNSGDGVKLQEQIDDMLQRTSLAANGKLKLVKLSEKSHQFVQDVLSSFDQLNAARIHAESKMLAGGDTTTSDTSLPVGLIRTVIKEALSDLNVLALVQTLTDPGAQGVTQIPYEMRDTSDVLNQGIVYEGQPIHRAGVSQEMDMAYILPMKLAFLISNEVVHFTRSSAINWDAYARNVESNARVMRELIAARICNELQRAADAYGAGSIADEAFDAQLTGANSVIKTVQFPIVRPHQQKDMKGNNVGSAENPITLTLNGTVISPYDGSGNQAAGTYYRVINYNLGYVQLVDETGAAVTPADTGTNTISYDYATNVAKFDTDLGGDTKAKHWNGFLQAVGSRKAILAQDRYEVPDFMLMSYTLNNDATDAENFTASGKRDGADTTAQGDLEMIKGLPAFSTNAPGVDMGEERALIGQRGTGTYTVAKPFMTGAPFEAVDSSSGKPIGKKQAYGEEYSAIKVPTPIRGRLTSVIAYSATGR